jgi:peptide/nickel transport system ATP-binding protein/oligopeptide transport system ATP-binding protein
VLGDGAEHATACLHPLEVGEDLSLATPRVDDTEIDIAPHREQEAESA